MLCVNCCCFHLNVFLHAIALVYSFFKLPHFHYYILSHAPYALLFDIAVFLF